MVPQRFLLTGHLELYTQLKILVTEDTCSKFLCNYYVLGGRLIAVGSGHMFSDKYIDQEQNEKFRESIFELLTTQTEINLISTDHDDIDVSSTKIIIHAFLIGLIAFIISIN